MENLVLCKKEVANLFGIHPSTVLRWCKEGRLPLPFSIGSNRTVWDKQEIMGSFEKLKYNRGFNGGKPGKCQ